MSWNVILMNVSSHIDDPEQLKENPPADLGAKETVLAGIHRRFPEFDFSDPAWVRMHNDDFSMEFNIGDADPIQTIMLNIRGSDRVIAMLRVLCQHFGWRALDTTTGKFIDFDDDPARGLRLWREYKDKVVRH